jgi:hypothetical protein
MGYYVDIAAGIRDFEEKEKAGGKAKARAALQFDRAMDDLRMAHKSMQEYYNFMAKPTDCVNMVMKFGITWPYVKSVRPDSQGQDYGAIARWENGDIKIDARFPIKNTRKSEQEPYVCSSCGLRIQPTGMNPDKTPKLLMGKDVSQAHNVIPCKYWPLIVSYSLEEISKNGELRPVPAGKLYLKAPAVTQDQLNADTRKALQLLAEIKRTQKVDISQLQESDAKLARLAGGLVNAGASCDSQGATTYDGGQCASCEKLHADLSLIQRVMLVRKNGGDSQKVVSLVSGSLTKCRSAEELNRAAGDQFEVLHTLRVASLVCRGMEDYLKKQCQTTALGLSILDKIDSFSSLVAAFAVKLCSEEPSKDSVARIKAYLAPA